MIKLRRYISTLLMLVLFLNMIPPANAAEGDPGKLSMTASADAVNRGDTLTVTITANQSFTSRGAGMTVCYDPAVLEPVPDSHQMASPFKVSGPVKVRGKTALRISFLPGEESHTFAADQALAVLTFKTLAPAENTVVEMTAADLYDSALKRIDLETAQEVKIGIKAISVTGITLDKNILELEIGSTGVLKAAVVPENASDLSVIWTSSDETKVTVENGVLTGKAITEEPVTITASVAGLSAECLVSVVYPPDAGYVVTMPQDSTAVVGETIAVAPVIGNAKGTELYNAYDMTFAYDPDMLLLTSTQLEDATVTVKDGTVNVIRYGTDREINTAPFMLTFRILKTGAATVTLTNARIDHAENAIIQNAAKAFCEYETVKFTVGGYTVSLPDDFSGDTVAEPGADYTFEAKDKCYDYTLEGSTMGGQSVAVKDNGDGTYTIENVTGNLIIQTEKTGKTFDVVLGEDMTGDSTARYMEDYSATLHEDDNYTYTLHVTIGGNFYNGYSKSGASYTIPGKDIMGKVIFTVTKTEIGTAPPSATWYDVTFEGSGAGAAGSYTASVAAGSSYTFTLNKEVGCRYSVSYTMGDGERKTVRPNEEGVYTIKNVQGNLVITVTKEVDDQDQSIEVYSYITLNEGKTMYLVLVSGSLDDSKIFTYADTPMYYRENYGAWCFLTVENSKLTAGLARKQIGTRTGQMDDIGADDFDVNMTGLVDINDAQLVYDMYNGKYEDFTVINMHRFLNADVNTDKRVTVNDAAGVVSNIK